MNRFVKTCLCAVFMLAPEAFCETQIQGNVSGVWTVEGNPYVLIDFSTVRQGTTLTINPGVVVQMGNYLLEGEEEDLSDTTFLVLGSIFIRGTAENPVRFIRPPGGDYGGIFTMSGDSAYAQHAIFETHLFVANNRTHFEDCSFVGRSSRSGLKLRLTPFGDDIPPVFLERCSFSEVAFTVDRGLADLMDCDFRDASLSFINQSRGLVESCSTSSGDFIVIIQSGSSANIIRSRLTGVTAEQSFAGLSLTHSIIEADGVAIDSADVEIVNNVFTRGSGIALTPDCEEVIIKNNVFHGSAIALFCSRWVEEPFENIDYNIFHDVTTLKTGLEQIGRFNREIDPIFQGGEPFDYRLRRGSPAIDTGDPERRDPDGSRSDIGAIPFDRQVNLPPRIVVDQQVFGSYGQEIGILAAVIDDGMYAHFEFEGLPEWLERIDPRVFDDTLRLVGAAPADAPSHYDVTINATDIDGSAISVPLVIDLYRTELRGDLRGRLSAENGPYWIGQSCAVRQGDTLTLSAGAVLLAHPEEGRDWPNIALSGVLAIEGTRDSICTLRGVDQIVFPISQRGSARFVAEYAEIECLSIWGNFGNEAQIRNCSLISSGIFGVTEIINSRLVHSGIGLRCTEDDTCRINGSEFENSGVNIESAPVVEIIDCSFTGTRGIRWIEGEWAPPTSILIADCTFEDVPDPLSISPSTSAIINNCDFINCTSQDRGMISISATDCTIRNSRFIGSKLEPWRAFAPAPFCLSVRSENEVSRLVFQGNRFTGNEGGVSVLSVDSLSITDNTFTENEGLLCVDNFTAGLFENNTMTGNFGSLQFGAENNFGQDNEGELLFRGNQFSNNRGGVIISLVDTMSITDNTFLGNALLLHARYFSRGVFENNLIAGNAGDLKFGPDNNFGPSVDSIAIVNNTMADGCLLLRRVDDGLCRNNIFTNPPAERGIPWDHSVPEDYNFFFGGARYPAIGNNSFVADPRFLGIDPYQYILRRDSPAIDRGMPVPPRDPDGTRRDLGYRPFDQDNRRPVIERDGRDTLRAHPGEEVIFRLIVSDEEGDSLVYRWFTNGEAAGSEVSLTVVTPDSGSMNVVAYAMDGNDYDSAAWVLTTSFEGIDDEKLLPVEFALHQPYPNPFNSRTTVAFDLPRTSEMSLDLYDMQGRRVSRLMEGKLEAGSRKFALDAGGLASGSYFLKLNAGQDEAVQRIILLR